MNRILPTLFLLGLLAVSCTNSKTEEYKLAQIQNLKMENDSLTNVLAKNNATIKNQIYTFLTFQDNNAENAMNFYIELFGNSKIINLQRWDKGGPGEEGRIMHATFELNGSFFMCSDSPPIHNWDFSPAISNYIDCNDESELERLFTKLSENGDITMPLNNYGFSQKFGWVIDQYGISWQLNLK